MERLIKGTLSHFYTKYGKYGKKLDFSETLLSKSLMCTLVIYKIIPTFNPLDFDEFTCLGWI